MPARKLVCSGEVESHAERTDIKKRPDHRRRLDRDRPGLRSFDYSARRRARRCARGLPRHPRELEPRDDHDGPRDGRFDSTSSRSTGGPSRGSSRRNGRTPCCLRWVARRRSTAPLDLVREALLEKFGVELIAASARAIDMPRTASCPQRDAQIGSSAPRSRIAHSNGGGARDPVRDRLPVA